MRLVLIKKMKRAKIWQLPNVNGFGRDFFWSSRNLPWFSFDPPVILKFVCIKLGLLYPFYFSIEVDFVCRKALSNFRRDWISYLYIFGQFVFSYLLGSRLVNFSRSSPTYRFCFNIVFVIFSGFALCVFLSFNFLRKIPKKHEDGRRCTQFSNQSRIAQGARTIPTRASRFRSVGSIAPYVDRREKSVANQRR